MPIDELSKLNVIQNKKDPSPNYSKYSLLLLSLVSLLIGVFITLIGFYIFSPANNQNLFINDSNSNVSVVPKTTSSNMGVSNNTDELTDKSIDLPTLLTEKCIKKGTGDFDYYISPSELPFVFGQSLYTKYDFSFGLNCDITSPFMLQGEGRRMPMRGYVSVSGKNNNSTQEILSVLSPSSQPELSNVKPLYLDFNSEETAKKFNKKIVEGDVTFLIDVFEVDPYGYSDLGIYITLDAYKYLNGYTLAYRVSFSLPVEGELKTMLSPYAIPTNMEEPDFPKYYYNNEIIPKLIINYFVPSLKDAKEPFKQLMESAIIDLNSIIIR